MITRIFKPEFEYLVDLNIHSLELTCDFLGIDFNYRVLSKMNLDTGIVNSPDEWALNICKASGFNRYINAYTGQKFIDKKKFSQHGVDVKFLEYEFKPYHQMGNSFEPGLSVIDVIMFNSPSEIRRMLLNYELV